MELIFFTEVIHGILWKLWIGVEYVVTILYILRCEVGATGRSRRTGCGGCARFRPGRSGDCGGEEGFSVDEGSSGRGHTWCVRCGGTGVWGLLGEEQGRNHGRGAWHHPAIGWRRKLASLVIE